MRYQCAKLLSGRWGIFAETHLLATIETQEECEKLLARLKTRAIQQTRWPKRVKNALELWANNPTFDLVEWAERAIGRDRITLDQYAEILELSQRFQLYEPSNPPTDLDLLDPLAPSVPLMFYRPEADEPSEKLTSDEQILAEQILAEQILADECCL